MTDCQLYTYRQRPDLVRAAENLIGEVWPEFMLHDSVADRRWASLEEDFPDYQFVLCDQAGEVIAVGNSIPLVWDGQVESLPEKGWDAALEQGFQDRQRGRRPNALSALSASVAASQQTASQQTASQQGRGLSCQVVEGMRRIAGQHGLAALIAPVRPSLKSRYPLIPIERYARWQRPDGSPFDPWLRVHARLGAELLRIAPESMTIRGKVADWEEWTGMRFPESGTYVIAEALVPVEMDCEADQGLYVEPNVWMRHAV